MKVIEITTEKAVYHLPLEFVAKHRAEYYKEDGFDEEVEFVMNDNYEGTDWMKNNMDFEDFEEALIKVKDLDIEEDWSNAQTDIIETGDN